MSPYCSLGAHTKTGWSHMAQDPIQTLLTPKGHYTSKIPQTHSRNTFRLLYVSFRCVEMTLRLKATLPFNVTQY